MGCRNHDVLYQLEALAWAPSCGGLPHHMALANSVAMTLKIETTEFLFSCHYLNVSKKCRLLKLYG